MNFAGLSDITGNIKEEIQDANPVGQSKLAKFATQKTPTQADNPPTQEIESSAAAEMTIILRKTNLFILYHACSIS